MQELQQLNKGIAAARKEAERLQREASAAQGERADLQLRAEVSPPPPPPATSSQPSVVYLLEHPPPPSAQARWLQFRICFDDAGA